MAEGTLKVLGRIPGASYNYGIWSAPDVEALHTAFATLPIVPYVEFEVTPPEEHPVVTGDDSDLGSRVRLCALSSKEQSSRVPPSSVSIHCGVCSVLGSGSCRRARRARTASVTAVASSATSCT